MNSNLSLSLNEEEVEYLKRCLAPMHISLLMFKITQGETEYYKINIKAHKSIELKIENFNKRQVIKNDKKEK